MSKIDYQEETVPQLVQRLEMQYKTGETTISEFVQWSLKDNTDKIDAYCNSKHISGDKDSKDRDKPFFNIVTGARNIWYRATNITRNQIKIKAGKSKNVVGAFLASVHLQDWMKREDFSAFLQQWGRTLATYGSAVVKFVKKDGKLIPTVIPWNRLIVDQIRFDNAPVIEVLDFTEDQLRQNKAYDQDMVDGLCNAKKARETMSGQKKDTKADFIRVYEVHGMMPLLVLKTAQGKKISKGDDEVYVQQMHVISYVLGEKKNGQDTYDEYTLVCGREDDPYMITHLLEEDGRVQAIGAVENLFESQWMVNHSMKAIKDQLDLSSKLIFQTSDGNFVGQNALSAIESGDILIHKLNEPLTHVANNANDITSLQNFQTMWKALGNEINGISDAMQGNVKAGAAWRQTEALLQESHSLFEEMTKNKCAQLEVMIRRFVIPYLKTKMDTADEISATLDQYDIQKIDTKFITNKAAEFATRDVVEMGIKFLEDAGPAPTPEIQNELTNQHANNLKSQLNENGNQRFFVPSDISDKTWKELFADLEWDVEVDCGQSDTESQLVMTTLNTAFQTLVAMQGRPMSPDEKMVFNKILTATAAVSPLELSASPSPIQTPAPVGQSVGGALPINQ